MTDTNETQVDYGECMLGLDCGNLARIQAEKRNNALAEELRALDAKATAGPWNHLGYCGQDGVIHGPRQQPIASLISGKNSTETGHWCHANAALIVALRNNLPAILAALDGDE